MRIVLSIPAFLPHSSGGGQVYVHQVGRELQRLGNAVTVLSDAPWQGGEGTRQVKRYEYDGLPVCCIQINPSAKGWDDDFTGLGTKLLEVLGSCLDEIRPDKVHLGGFKAPLNRICLERGIPHVATAHHPGVVCPAGTLLTHRRKLCTARATREICVPCCTKQRSRNGAVGALLSVVPEPLARRASAWGTRKGRLGFIARALAYARGIERSLASKEDLLRRVPIWIAPSHAIRTYLILNGAPKESVRVVPHGIEPMDRLSLEPYQRRPLRFGYMGEMAIPKGFHVLIQALSLMDPSADCELHVFSKAHHPWNKRYLDDSLRRFRGKPPVIFHDTVSRGALSSAYAQFDVLVVPSIFLEVLGLVILESFAAGRPVIATQSGGPAELIRHGVDGLLVRRNDPRDLARAMEILVENRGEVERMAGNIMPVRTIRQHVEDLLPVYEEARHSIGPAVLRNVSSKGSR